MNVTIEPVDLNDRQSNIVLLYGTEVPAKNLPLKKDESSYVNSHRKDNSNCLICLSRLPGFVWVQNFNADLDASESHEALRNMAAEIQLLLVQNKVEKLVISGVGVIPEEAVAFLEGLHMANYRFDKYKSVKETLLSHIVIDEKLLSQDVLDENLRLWNNIEQCRNWVNEPVVSLNAETFAKEIQERCSALGNVKCTVFGKKKIETLKMGGLLAVNKGSVDEPRFVTLEYKPANRANENPIALVGKGIMFDTGGLNIKPDDYMQEMKSDMAGAATMASVLFAAAENHLPVHLMAFLPLTDSRPGFNAYAPDDIIRMYDGTTVEVVNTDAEGRVILADAIAYANEFSPELIIDAATLTGAAVRAIGTFGIAAMQQNAKNQIELLKIVGDQVYERIVEFPFWKEYDKLIKSDVADIKNCGISQAGCITAGKFLAHFAKHPYIHLDIAGVAYYSKRESFYGVGASGYAIRLLYAFFQTYDILHDIK